MPASHQNDLYHLSNSHIFFSERPQYPFKHAFISKLSITTPLSSLSYFSPTVKPHQEPTTYYPTSKAQHYIPIPPSSRAPLTWSRRQRLFVHRQISAPGLSMVSDSADGVSTYDNSCTFFPWISWGPGNVGRECSV